MSVQNISLDIEITWTRPRNKQNQPYRWGDSKQTSVDPIWAKENVLYRWVRHSTGEVAHIGETERQLTKRVDNYTSAKSKGSAGSTNRRLYAEQQQLVSVSDYLFLECTDRVPGYNLNVDHDRKFAESLLVGYTKPYLTFSCNKSSIGGAT